MRLGVRVRDRVRLWIVWMDGWGMGSEIDRGRGPEVALYAEGTGLLCTEKLSLFGVL